MIASILPDRSINVSKGLKIFKTNDFAQAEERYRSLDKIGQKHMIGDLVADLSHVIIPAIRRRAIENLRQADETLAASVEPKGIRGYIEIKKAILEFSILSRNHSLVAFTLAFRLPDCYARLLFPQVNNLYESTTSLIPGPISS